MKTLLVPVDFTATSENAVNFAIEWCRTYEYERIILLKTFYDSIFEGLIVSAEYSNVNEEYTTGNVKMTESNLMLYVKALLTD